MKYKLYKIKLKIHLIIKNLKNSLIIKLGGYIFDPKRSVGIVFNEQKYEKSVLGVSRIFRCNNTYDIDVNEVEDTLINDLADLIKQSSKSFFESNICHIQMKEIPPN